MRALLFLAALFSFVVAGCSVTWQTQSWMTGAFAAIGLVTVTAALWAARGQP